MLYEKQENRAFSRRKHQPLMRKQVGNKSPIAWDMFTQNKSFIGTIKATLCLWRNFDAAQQFKYKYSI